MNRILLTIAAFLSITVTEGGLAQDQTMKPGNIIPPPALMSEEVATQKAISYGVTNIRQIQAVGDTYVILGKYENRQMELELDRLSGELREKGVRAPLKPAIPLIQGQQIKIERKDMVRPEFMPEPQ